MVIVGLSAHAKIEKLKTWKFGNLDNIIDNMHNEELSQYIK